MLTLVIPVYKNEASLPALLATVSDMHRHLQGALEAVFVVDGSPDRCYEMLHRELPECDFKSRLVLLARNFGSFAAIRAGLAIGSSEHFAVMAADLQEPPELVFQMHDVLCQGEADVVVGVREARAEPWPTRLAANTFWWLYRRYILPEIPPGGVDIFACNRHFRDTLLALEERHSSLIAQIFWLGFRRAEVRYQRLPRQHGQSAWTWRKKADYLADSLFAFSDLPIRLLFRSGMAGLGAAAIMGITVLIAKATGAITVPGYTMTMLTLLLFGALNLLGLGIVGSYAWRAYENTKARPIAIPLRIEEFDA